MTDDPNLTAKAVVTSVPLISGAGSVTTATKVTAMSACESCGFPETCGTDDETGRVCTMCAVDAARDGWTVTWDEDAPRAIVELADRHHHRRSATP